MTLNSEGTFAEDSAFLALTLKGEMSALGRFVSDVAVT